MEYFTAPDDAAAAGVLFGGPETVFPTVSCGNFLADAAMTEWESLLLGRAVGERDTSPRPRVVAGLGSGRAARVFAASAALQSALAGAGREALAALAERWIAERWAAEYAEELGEMRAETVREILWQLADLARAAGALRQAVYCWMC